MSVVAKKMKLNDEEDLFIKYNVPVEIIEKIVGFVPSKKNCFLVSKTFYRESIKATRKKCLLIMDRENIVLEGFINVQRAFNEIRWKGGDYGKPNDDLFIRRSKPILEKFGLQVENLTLDATTINKSALLEVLSLMPNLVKLHLNYCDILVDCKPSQSVANLELSKLEKISFDVTQNVNELLDNISCPSIRSAHQWDGSETSLKFLLQHKQLEDIAIAPDGRDRRFDDQLFENLCQLKLTTLGLSSVNDAHQIAALILRQPQLTSLEISNINDINDHVLQKIGNLQNLESLSINIRGAVSGQLVHDLLQLPKLKKLDIVGSENVLKVILTTRNLQLESLRIGELYTINLQQESQNLSSVFPNLRSLEIVGFTYNFNCFMRFEKLKSLNVQFFSDIVNYDECTELIVNESVRKLKFSLSVLPGLLQRMPNIEKLNIASECGEKIETATAKTLFNEMLSLKKLVEIEGNSGILLNEAVIDCINNCIGSSNLERITFCHWGNLESAIVSAYEEKFPFKHVNYGKEKISMSRY